MAAFWVVLQRYGMENPDANGHLLCVSPVPGQLLQAAFLWDVNSANYQYFAKAHSRYPADYVKTHRGAPHNIGWKEPLSAILTLWPNGRIKIEGAKSDWLFGVSPEDAGYPAYDEDGRETLPVIKSADMTFAYSGVRP